MIKYEDCVFTLQAGKLCYQMMIDKHSKLLHLHTGSEVKESTSHLLSFADRGFSANIEEEGRERTYSYDFLPCEVSERGLGDFRSSSILIEAEDGSITTDFRFESYSIKKGVIDIHPLPMAYGEDAETLEIKLKDEKLDCFLILYYCLIDNAIITARKLIAGSPLSVRKLSSLSLDFMYQDYEIMSFNGRHCYERQPLIQEVRENRITISSRRGTSSHQANPFIILAEKGTDEVHGNCFGVHLLWSGSFQIEAERNQFSSTRLIASAEDEFFTFELKKGETLTMPAALLTFSEQGYTSLSNDIAAFTRKHILRLPKEYRNYVLLNSWEACYMDFNGEKLIKLAKDAAELDTDLFVLDDGWFLGRNDDYTSLGDWQEDESKLGMSLSELSEKIRKTGMAFGLWVEPEMVNEESNLYKQHPDWALKTPGRKLVRSRYQLVLDLSRTEVAEYILETLKKLFRGKNLSYVKWDYNRSITDFYSATASRENQQSVGYRYMQNLYWILYELRKEFPSILFEGCSGGGGRFDMGMLCYTPQIWLSDNTDAIDRLDIQFGSSYGYPIAAFGSHVSTCPNHQNGRITPLYTRSTVAFMGSYGLEFTPATLTESEKAELKSEIAEYRKQAELIKKGNLYRLRKDENIAAWLIVSNDSKEALLSAVKLSTHGNDLDYCIRLRGLEKDVIYEVAGQHFHGSTLMNAGLKLHFENKEYSAFRLAIKALQ